MKKTLTVLIMLLIAIVVYTNVTVPNKRESTPTPVIARVEKHQRTEVAMVRESEAIAPVAQTEKVWTNETGPYHVRMEGVQVELVPSRKQ